MPGMNNKYADLKAIKEKIITLRGFPLKKTAKNIVFGKGNPDAEIFFVGEAPGAQEDARGIPFIGAAGKQLDVLLHSISLNLDVVYIANILKYRPPWNRNPNVEEIRAHTPFLIQQIQIIRPKIIVTLGNFATKFVLAGFAADKMDTVPGISQLHGKARTLKLNALPLTVIPLYHPAALLYNAGLKKVMQADFKAIKKYLS